MLVSLSRAAALVALALSTALPVQAQSGGSSAQSDLGHQAPDHRHVLLISVDGLHASDMQQFVAAHSHSTLAGLMGSGTTYANAYTPTPSDSFPGLLAMVTGGTPKTTGVFYDDTYARDLWAPDNPTCSGAPGTETLYAENLDKTVNGMIPLIPLGIDPTTLPNGMINGTCQRIYPHQFLQVNTIFEVAREHGLPTAWSDKHPAYEIVNGPSGRGVDDLFTPEINNDKDPTKISVAATNAYDDLKVLAILNQIDGKRSDGSRPAPVPAIFGMNFQAVSVGEKLVDPVQSCERNTSTTPPLCDPNYFPGGYEPGSLKFTPQMELAMTHVDESLGAMVSALRSRGLWSSTKMIVSAKHGQSPIDPATLQKVGDPLSPIIGAANIAQITTDDIALIWLKDQSKTAEVVAKLNARAADARIQYILWGDALAQRFGDPLKNARTPELIVQPIPGTIYTSSKVKVAEHGGFAEDDTHVALIVAGASKNTARTVQTGVHTMQIAPTILRFLGLNPQALTSVRLEGTRPLPN